MLQLRALLVSLVLAVTAVSGAAIAPSAGAATVHHHKVGDLPCC